MQLFTASFLSISKGALLKKWIQKFVHQLNVDTNDNSKNSSSEVEVSEDRATLLFLLDTYSKHLIETEVFPVRRVREALDEFAKNLLQQTDDNLEKTFFRLRQFMSSHRIDEYTYVQKNFDEFRRLIWDLIENLSEDLTAENSEDLGLAAKVQQLREAMELNSVEQIKCQSREFINSYIKIQEQKQIRRGKRSETVKRQLSQVKKQLVDANNTLRLDHLTKAYNRRCFEEQIRQQWNLFQISRQPVSLLMLDIDFFKRINDTFGHAMGDLVLVECVKMLKEVFPREVDSISRIGGEEFAVLLPDYQIEHAIKKSEVALNKFRGETIVDKDMQAKFTISIGIAQLMESESIENWMKRADTALYDSKKSGRDRYTVAAHVQLKKDHVA